MSSHKIRLAVIAALLLTALVGAIVLVALEQTTGPGFGFVTGVFTTMLPAFLDAATVERRRRDPRVPALPDDVREGRNPAPPHSP